MSRTIPSIVIAVFPLPTLVPINTNFSSSVISFIVKFSLKGIKGCSGNLPASEPIFFARSDIVGRIPLFPFSFTEASTPLATVANLLPLSIVYNFSCSGRIFSALFIASIIFLTTGEFGVEIT